MRAKVVILSLLMSINRGVEAGSSPRTNPEGCSNEQCVTDAANLGVVLGLLAGTMAPIWLKPYGARSFVTHRSGEIRAGGFIDRSKYASMEFDFSEWPDSDIGLQTRLTMTGLSGGHLTSLRYHALMDYAVLKTRDVRLAMGSGLAVEKIMEESPIYPGVPLVVSFQGYLSGAWRFKSRASVTLLKQPVYRGDLQLIWITSKNSDGLDFLFGYEYEDHRLTDGTIHYLTVGITI